MTRRDRYTGQAMAPKNWPRYLQSTADYGVDQNRSTGGTYVRLTGAVYMHVPFLVKSILWDVRIADTYICRFVTTMNGTTSEFDVNTNVVVGGAGEIEITPTNGDFVMTPGAYFLQLVVSDAGTNLWYDYNAERYTSSIVSLAGVYYTTSEFLEYTIPVKFRGSPLITDTFTKYARI